MMVSVEVKNKVSEKKKMGRMSSRGTLRSLNIQNLEVSYLGNVTYLLIFG